MAVYTEVSEDELISFISQYDIGDLISVEGIAEGVENSNYLLKTTKRLYILTIYEKRVRIDDLPFFLGLLEYLAEKDFPAPVPIRGRDGRTLKKLAGKPAAICSFLEGMWPRKISFRHCQQVGETAALLHITAAEVTLYRSNDLGPSGWLKLANSTLAHADYISDGLSDLINKELDFLLARWPTDLPKGVIHGDMFPDNVFFKKEKLSGVIDFYFACNDLLAYELAVCLNAWCFDSDTKYRSDCGTALIGGYSRLRLLTSEEKIALPILFSGRSPEISVNQTLRYYT